MERLGYLGCDVSKGYSDFKLLLNFSKEAEEFKGLDDNRSGHKALFKKIEEIKKKYNLLKIIVGMESTGGYENNWYTGLRRQSKNLSLEVYRINPKKIFYQGKIESADAIDDKVSSYLIASHLKKNYGEKHLEPKRITEKRIEDRGAQVLHKHIKQISKSNVRLKNSLEKLLYTNMPELLGYKKDKWTNWLLELLIRYPSKKRIINAGIKGLVKIRYITESKAKEIIEVMKSSIGSSTSSIESKVIKLKAKSIKEYQKELKDLRKDLVKALRKTNEEDLNLLQSLGGIGEDTAASIMVALPNLKHFEKASSLVSFWGLNPSYKISGDGAVKRGMSKDGCSMARAELYIAVKNLILHEPYFKGLYHKYRTRGKGHMTTIGILMAKLARIIFGILKSRKPFNSGIDTLNQNKKPSITKSNINQLNKIIKKKNHLKSSKTTAPISRVERAKRKKIEQLS